jgi:AraC family transcriptional regulator, transcriptional activator of the genes for pyochelin and ferripyochelin receptors
MTLILVETDIEQHLNATDSHNLNSSALATFDLTLKDPQQLSRGYRRWLHLRPGLLLLIQDYHLRDPLVVETEQSAPKGEFEFGFNLLGDRQDHYLEPGCHFLALEVETEPGLSQVEWSANQHIQKVDIHVEATALHTLLGGRLAALPPAVRAFMEGKSPSDFYQTGQITPAMRLSLQQILNSPYQGLTQQLYLESKCLEVIALQLEQLNSNCKKRSAKVLAEDDIQRVYWAKDILLSRLQNPPSLLELAQQVGLNDYKLKIGFRQVFGTTTFGYWQFYRMEQARQLLEQKQMSVKEVSLALGYSQPRYFAAAFKQQYGVPPQTYRTAAAITPLSGATPEKIRFSV